ncbi:hypothetical protein H4I96_01621 [Botrytis cinerea]
MATTIHETPEWETPTPKKSFLDKYNLFSKPQSTLPTTKEGSSDSSGNAVATETFGKHTLVERFNNVLPANRTYFWTESQGASVDCRRCNSIITCFDPGVGLGLGLKHSSSKALPLPSNGGIFTGDLTYYAPGLGACGITSSSSESICAVSHIIFDAASTSSNPNANPLCGRKIRITRQKASGSGNNTVDVTVVDRCVGCKAEDLDLSITVFEKLALEAEGRVTGSWAWL